jgi:hypothetical protein
MPPWQPARELNRVSGRLNIRANQEYHWYHLRLLRVIWPAQMKGLAAEASRHADLLGDDHDLAVLRMTLAHDGDTLGTPRTECEAAPGCRRAGECAPPTGSSMPCSSLQAITGIRVLN